MAGKENKRDLILLALERLLPGRRFHEITLEEVAREAQVGKGTIYLYFKDKDALFAEMTFSRAEALCAALETLRNDDVPERLLDRAAALIEEFLARHRSWFGAQTELAAHVMRLEQDYETRRTALQEKLFVTLSGLLSRALDRPENDCRTPARILLWPGSCSG